MHHFHIKSSCSHRRMIDVEAGTLTMFCNEAKGTRVLVSATEMIRLSCAFVVIRGWPGRERFFDECRILRRVRKLDTVCRGTCKSQPISVSVIYPLRPSILPLSHSLNSFRGFEAMAQRLMLLSTISIWPKTYGRWLYVSANEADIK